MSNAAEMFSFEPNPTRAQKSPALYYFMIPTYEIDAGPPERGVAG
jgi:hypothetical protein